MDTTAKLFVFGALCVVVPVLIAIAAWFAVARAKAGSHRKNTGAVKAAISEYFRNSGIDVSVECLQLPGSDRYTVFIESEPMKQMRLSHIIETSLRDLVHNLHRIELDKIYWRFPIKNRPPGDAPPKEKKPEDDNYITEGLSLRHLPKADVSEASWDVFQQASTRGPDPDK